MTDPTPGSNDAGTNLTSNPDYGSAGSASAAAEVASAAHIAVEVAAEKLAHTEKVLREAGGPSANVSNSAQQVYDSAENALASVKEYVSRNPLPSVGIALAAGFVMSSVVKRSW